MSNCYPGICAQDRISTRQKPGFKIIDYQIITDVFECGECGEYGEKVS